MKKADIVAGLILALIIGVVWLVATRPPWVGAAIENIRQWLGQGERPRIVDPDFRGFRESRRRALGWKPVPVAPATGLVTGTVHGLRQVETGSVFAIRGAYQPENNIEDDLYELGDIAQREATVSKDGTFRIDNLKIGHYTIVAIVREFGVAEGDRRFRRASVGVDVSADGQAQLSLSAE